MASLTESIVKALAPDDTDSDAERARKQLVRKQLQAGAITVERYAAELAIEGLAKSAYKRDPSRSYEQHYVAQLDANPVCVLNICPR